jgi:hypothetical protein
MTVLVFNIIDHRKFSRLVVSSQWTITQSVPGICTVDGHGMDCDRVLIYCNADEFLALIAEGGKIVDLRKLQESK